MEPARAIILFIALNVDGATLDMLAKEQNHWQVPGSFLWYKK